MGASLQGQQLRLSSLKLLRDQYLDQKPHGNCRDIGYVHQYSPTASCFFSLLTLPSFPLTLARVPKLKAPLNGLIVYGFVDTLAECKHFRGSFEGACWVGIMQRGHVSKFAFAMAKGRSMESSALRSRGS